MTLLLTSLTLTSLGCLSAPAERSGGLLPLCVDEESEALLVEHPALAPIPTAVLEDAKLTWPTLTWVQAGAACEDCESAALSFPVPESAIEWQPPEQALVLP